ncbi:MAG: hypothetical protein P4L93_07955 [Coriobacteriia bacterium]|nr:hypothetical protein [Coriobacteriia bacterium]
MPRTMKGLAAVLALLAVLAVAGCQPSISSQLEAGLPQASKLATMPAEVGRDADTAGNELLDAQLQVKVVVPARSAPASTTPKGEKVAAFTIPPVTVDLTPSDRRFLGFTVISQEPAAGGSLASSQTVVLTVGPHLRAPANSTWYGAHATDDVGYGQSSCLDSGSGGQTGCHSQAYCNDCHNKTIKPAKP